MNSALNSLFHNDCKIKDKKPCFRGEQFYPLKIVHFAEFLSGKAEPCIWGAENYATDSFLSYFSTANRQQLRRQLRKGNYPSKRGIIK